MKNHKQHQNILGTLLAVAATCLAIQSAQADLLFSEAFNYNTGNLAGNVNPGNSTAWSTAGSALSIVSGNLTYPGLPDQGGNALQISSGTVVSSINIFANQTSGQIYYSFLFNASVVNSGNTYFTALNPSSTAPGGGSDAIDAYYYANGGMRLRANAQSATAGTGTALTLGTTYFIVEMINLDAKTASLWLNPNSSTFDSTAPTATASLSSITATAVDNVGFKNAGTGTFVVDNLLIGTTWADVTSAVPAPEPSTLALIGGGAVLALILRRRQSRN